MVHDMKDVKRTYYNDGTIKSEGYYTNNYRHRTDGPTITWYYKNGNMEREMYYFLNQIHRTDAPAVTYYKQDGTIEREMYYKNHIDITNALQQAHYFEADEHTKALIWNMI